VIARSTKQLERLVLIGDYVAVVQYCPPSSHRPAHFIRTFTCADHGWCALLSASICLLVVVAHFCRHAFVLRAFVGSPVVHLSHVCTSLWQAIL